eukprot:scaffold271912_cov21-Tisochrysis_lutea.AAC.2
MLYLSGLNCGLAVSRMPNEARRVFRNSKNCAVYRNSKKNNAAARHDGNDVSSLAQVKHISMGEERYGQPDKQLGNLHGLAVKELDGNVNSVRDLSALAGTSWAEPCFWFDVYSVNQLWDVLCSLRAGGLQHDDLVTHATRGLQHDILVIHVGYVVGVSLLSGPSVECANTNNMPAPLTLRRRTSKCGQYV